MSIYYTKNEESYMGECSTEEGTRLLLHNDEKSLTYFLNSTALWIWDNCVGTDFESLYSKFEEKYHIEKKKRQKYEQILQRTLNDMIDKGVVFKNER